MKSRIENAAEESMGRGGWRWERGLRSQIENAGEERMGRVRWRMEGALKIRSHFGIGQMVKRMAREAQF